MGGKIKSEKGEFKAIHVVLIFVVVIVIGAGAYFIAGRPAQEEKENLRIGIIYPKTGIYSAIGPPVLDGHLMAIEDHGEILGSKPTVFVRDSHTEKSKSITAAKELIKNKKVHILLGAINTPINNAIATICDKNEVPFLYPSGGSVSMSGIKTNPHPYMFFASGNALDQSIGAVHAAKIYGSRFYFIASDYEYGHDTVDHAKSLLRERVKDFEVVGESFFPQGAKDYIAAIAKAKSANPDIVHVTLPGVFTAFQKQAVQMGLMDVAHIYWAYASRPAGFATGKSAVGVTSFTLSSFDVPSIEDWADRFHEKYGYWAAWPATQAYNGTDMFLAAVEKAGTYDGLRIVKTLEGMKYAKSIFGPETYFRAVNHHMRYPAYFVEWAQSEKYNGGYWKTVRRFSIEEMEELSIPVENTANYPAMRGE